MTATDARGNSTHATRDARGVYEYLDYPLLLLGEKVVFSNPTPRREHRWALPLAVATILALSLGGCGIGERCCPFEYGYAYIVAEREIKFKFGLVFPFSIKESHRSYDYMEYIDYWGPHTPLGTLSIHTHVDIENTHDIPIFVFLNYLAQEEGVWVKKSPPGNFFDIGLQLTPPFFSDRGGYNHSQFSAALALYHQEHCPEVSGTGISDNTADSGYYTFLDQCEGVIVIKPGETKPFHYNGYGSPRE